MTKEEKLNKLIDILCNIVDNLLLRLPIDLKIFKERVLPLREMDNVKYLTILYAISKDEQFLQKLDKDFSIVDKVSFQW